MKGTKFKCAHSKFLQNIDEGGVKRPNTIFYAIIMTIVFVGALFIMDYDFSIKKTKKLWSVGFYSVLVIQFVETFYYAEYDNLRRNFIIQYFKDKNNSYPKFMTLIVFIVIEFIDMCCSFFMIPIYILRHFKSKKLMLHYSSIGEEVEQESDEPK